MRVWLLWWCARSRARGEIYPPPTFPPSLPAGALKWFMYGQDDKGGFHLTEVVFDKSTGAIGVTVKSDAGAAAPVAAAGIRAMLGSLC